MTHPFTIINVAGPYREPREPVLSYDYAVQRPTWPMAQAVRVKVSIPDELDVWKTTILEISGGTPGQQMMINQALSRRLADEKLKIANEEGLFLERADLLIGPFSGGHPLQHLWGRLETWMHDVSTQVREEITRRTGMTLQSPSTKPTT
jgi:hypothetical protein